MRLKFEFLLNEQCDEVQGFSLAIPDKIENCHHTTPGGAAPRRRLWSYGLPLERRARGRSSAFHTTAPLAYDQLNLALSRGQKINNILAVPRTGPER
jgi:hypothetical protein